MMTDRERTQIERAMTRAHQNGIQIAGKGMRKSDNRAVYAVTSASEPNRWHLVVPMHGRLTCTCPAGQHGTICMHRGLIHEYLKTHATRTAD